MQLAYASGAERDRHYREVRNGLSTYCAYLLLCVQLLSLYGIPVLKQVSGFSCQGLAATRESKCQKGNGIFPALLPYGRAEPWPPPIRPPI